MGLEIVDMMMTVEKEFGISIPDAIAPNLVRLGDIHAYAVNALQQQSDAAIDPDVIWERLKALLVRDFAFREAQLVPGAHIVFDLGMD